MAGIELRVRVLGGLAVEGLSEPDIGSRKGRSLLKVLALARRAPVSSDRLAEILWGDEPPSRPAEQVGVLVSRLRGVVGSDRVVRTDAGYLLNLDWLDLVELEARVAEAADALDGSRLTAARAAAAAAVSLARGELLPDEEGTWVEPDRAAATNLVRAAHRIGAEAAARAGDRAAAAALAEQALAADPCDEGTLRILMSAHVSAGRPAAALAAYVRVREQLAEDLGVSPTPETEALHDAIVLGSVGADPEPATTPSVLPGRHAEMAALDTAFDRVVGNAGSRIVLVDGVGGVGKTELVTRWTRHLPASVLLVVGRCDELGRDLPLQPIADAVVGLLAGRSPAERGQILGADADVVRPLLAADPHAAGGATRVIDEESGRAGLFAALASVFARLAGDGAVVLVVEDLHLDSGASAAWLAYARRRLPRLLVVATSRPPSGPELHPDTHIPLDVLGVDAVAEIVGHERADEVHARTGGLPLLVTAVHHLDRDAGPNGQEATGVPSATLPAAVERRVSGLAEAETTIRTAAILGGRVDLDLLADVMRRPAVELLGHLEAAATAGVLVDDGSFRFRHELEREVLDEAAGSTRRAWIHREAARVLSTRAQPDALAVAVHARLGGEIDLAMAAFVQAAHKAEARFDLAAAEHHVDAALALGDSAVALVTRARLRMSALRLDDAEADGVRAVAAGGGSRALEVAGWIAYYQRRYDTALARADEAVARADDDDIRASCHALAGRILHGSGSLDAAAARLSQATGAGLAPEVRGLASVWLAQLRTHTGDPVEAGVLAERALSDPDHLGHPFAPLHGRFARIMALGHRGAIGDALLACDEIDAACARAGAAGQRFFGPAANVRAWLLRWSGLAEEADALNAAAVEASDPTGPRSESYYAGLLDLVDGRLLVGDADGASVVFDRLAPIAGWRGTMAWHQRHRWLLAQARSALAAGDPVSARALAAGVEHDAAARGAHRYRALAAAVAALAAIADGAVGLAADSDVVVALIADLGTSSALDGWPLVSSLGRAYGEPSWVAEAEIRGAALVASSPYPERLGALVDRVLSR